MLCHYYYLGVYQQFEAYKYGNTVTQSIILSCSTDVTYLVPHCDARVDEREAGGVGAGRQLAAVILQLLHCKLRFLS